MSFYKFQKLNVRLGWLSQVYSVNDYIYLPCSSGGSADNWSWMIWWYISCLNTLIVNQNSANTKSMSYSGDILSLARNVYNWFYVIIC